MSFVSESDLQARGVRLFCLPHAGSGAAGFYRWKRLLPASIAVCPVQLPGRERRLAEPLAVDARKLAEATLEALGPWLAEPYAIFGHSMGALLGYELCRQAAAAGCPAPRWLFASGRNAPQLPPPHRTLHRLGEEAFLQALRERFGAAQDEVLADPEMRALFLPILRADLQLVETYDGTPGPPLRCPVAAFAGLVDASVSEAGLRAWGELTTAGCVVERFTGDHFYHLGSVGLLAEIRSRLG